MKRITIVLLIATLFTACEEGFLELSPPSEANVNNFFQDANDFNTALMACYGQLQKYVNTYFDLVEYRSGNLNIIAPTASNLERYNIDRFVETSANSIIRDAWALYYNTILRCNKIISQAEGIDMNEALKQQYIGESRFIRALTYFNLVRFWGNVPIVLKPISPEEALKIGRSEISEVYAVIEEDLIAAVEYLPESYNDNDIGRATSGAAKSLLGKVYLTQNKYSEAKSILSQVLNKYSLLDSINDVFDVANKMNAEVIFAIRFNKEVIGEGHSSWFAVSDVSTSHISDYLLNSYSANDKRKSLVEYSQVGTGFVLNKFYDLQSSTTKKVGNDYIILRYSDVLLMYAEALAEEGDLNNALNYLNMVHQRAGLPEILSSELPDIQSMKEALLKERKLEFPLEGKIWFDLIRTGTAISEIAKIGITIQEYQLIYPVPHTEVEKINNDNIFPQNPGYN